MASWACSARSRKLGHRADGSAKTKLRAFPGSVRGSLFPQISHQKWAMAHLNLVKFGQATCTCSSQLWSQTRCPGHVQNTCKLLELPPSSPWLGIICATGTATVKLRLPRMLISSHCVPLRSNVRINNVVNN